MGREGEKGGERGRDKRREGALREERGRGGGREGEKGGEG